jgi:hypothetical protein
MKIRNLSNQSPFARKILLFSPSGNGKTFLCGTAQDAPEMKDVLIVPLDGGASTLDGKNIDVAEGVRTLAEAEKLLWSFAQNPRPAEFVKYKTLVLDGASEVARRELQEITTKAAKDKSDRDRDQAQLQDHGLRNSRLMRILRMARDLPDITVIVTAWPKFTFPKIPDAKGKLVENKEARPTEISIDFSDSLLDPIIGAFDAVWFLQNDTVNDRRVLITADYDNVRAKTRNAAFADELTTEGKDGKRFPVVINPTFKGIVEAYRRAMEKQTQETANNSKEPK